MTAREQRQDRAEETEERFVRSDDPNLTPEANRLLTQEAREAVGRERVRVPAGREPRPQPAGPRRSPLAANLIANRQVMLVTLLVALVVGGIVTLVTDSWWALVAALALHAVGTLLAAGGAIQISTQTEHVSPSVAARLEEEGVSDPDRLLTDLVESFGPEPEAESPTAEALSGGAADDHTARPADQPARAAAQQRTTMTPSSAPSEPAGAGEQLGGADLGAGDGAPTAKRLIPIAALVVAGVVVFMVLMGVVSGLL